MLVASLCCNSPARPSSPENPRYSGATPLPSPASVKSFATSRKTPAQAPGGRAGLFPEVGAGVEGGALDDDLVVEVGSGAAAGVARQTVHVTALDLLATGDADGLQVPEAALDVLAVVEEHGIAVATQVAREDDGAGSRRGHRSADRG